MSLCSHALIGEFGAAALVLSLLASPLAAQAEIPPELETMRAGRIAQRPAENMLVVAAKGDPAIIGAQAFSLSHGGTQAGAAPQESPAPPDYVIGSWEGTLEYLDYGDDESLVQLPTRLDVRPEEDAGALIFEFSYEEPDGRVVTARERLRETERGVYFGAVWQVEERRFDDTAGTYRLVLKREGDDNDRKATIRTVMEAEPGRLTITRFVRYEGSEKELQRNQYRFKSSVSASDLMGVWKVDLRPTPDAEPYVQEFTVESVDGDSITGTFYGTPIQEGRFNVDWGALRFAFVTADGSGPYHHSGLLSNGRLIGMTHSLGRDFLAYWTAVRESGP